MDLKIILISSNFLFIYCFISVDITIMNLISIFILITPIWILIIGHVIFINILIIFIVILLFLNPILINFILLFLIFFNLSLFIYSSIHHFINEYFYFTNFLRLFYKYNFISTPKVIILIITLVIFSIPVLFHARTLSMVIILLIMWIIHIMDIFMIMIIILFI